MFRGAYTVEWFNECTVYFRAWLDNYIRLQRPAKVSLSKFISWTEKTAASPPLVFPAKWRLRDECRNSTLMTCCYSDLGGASDWSPWREICFNQSEALPRSGVWGVQHGISALVPHTSFRGKPVVASRKVGCFLRVILSSFNTKFLSVPQYYY